jgi:glycerophosphoryl diester phosphodiesterase
VAVATRQRKVTVICKPWDAIATVFLMMMGGSRAESQMITAHRGASHDAPENTLVAFRLAWEQQADAIEGDFRLTADGHVVCIHDADTERTCGVRRVVAETSLDDLRSLDFGRWKAPAFSGQPCCTLEEVLEIVPAGKRFFIELKTGPEIVEPLGRIIERCNPDLSSLVVIAFDEKTIAACKKRLPGVKAHWLTSFKETRTGSNEWHPSVEQVFETVLRCGADGVGLQARRQVVNREFVQQLRTGGVDEFHVWTVDSPEDARFFVDLGAMGITTNRPALMRRLLFTP